MRAHMNVCGMLVDIYAACVNERVHPDVYAFPHRPLCVFTACVYTGVSAYHVSVWTEAAA